MGQGMDGMNEGWEPEDVEDNQRTRRPTLLNEPERLRIEAAGLFHRARKAEEKNKALTIERDQLRAELIKVLRFVGGQATPDVSTSSLLNVSEEVSAVLGEMAGEAATLRTEVERLRENSSRITGRAEAAIRVAELATTHIAAVESTVAGLRRALDTARVEVGWIIRNTEPSGTDSGHLSTERAARSCQAGIIAALAASPAEHERRIKAEALREVAKAASVHPGAKDWEWNELFAFLLAEADRLEKEAANGKT